MNSSRGMVRGSSSSSGLSRQRRDEEPSGVEVHGGEDARDRVFAFLTETVGTVKIDDILVQLFQYGFHGNEPFKQWEIKPTDDLNELSDEIVQEAEEDISTSGARKTSYGLKLAQHNGRKNFVLTTISNEDDGPGFGINEAEMIPTLKHITAQQMSHNQILFEASIGSFGQQLKMMSKMLTKANERIEWLQAERERYMESREAIFSEQHDRDMDMKRQEKKDFYMGQIVSMGVNAIGPIVNKLAQQKIIAEKATPLETLMIGLASTLEGPQIDAIIQSKALTLPQLNSLMTIVKTIRENFDAGGTGAGPTPHSVGQADGVQPGSPGQQNGSNH